MKAISLECISLFRQSSDKHVLTTIRPSPQRHMLIFTTFHFQCQLVIRKESQRRQPLAYKWRRMCATSIKPTALVTRQLANWPMGRWAGAIGVIGEALAGEMQVAATQS